MLLASCFAHPDHPLMPRRRWTVLFSSCAFAFFLAAVIAVFVGAEPAWWAFWERAEALSLAKKWDDASGFERRRRRMEKRRRR